MNKLYTWNIEADGFSLRLHHPNYETGWKIANALKGLYGAEIFEHPVDVDDCDE